MQTQHTGYLISDDDVEAVYQAIQKGGEETHLSLMIICYNTYKEIAIDLFTSIAFGLSYDYMTTYMHDINISRNMFYAYRRKVLSVWAIMNGYEVKTVRD